MVCINYLLRNVRMATALAAVVNVCMWASTATAEIVYHSANITISDGTYNLDLNGDGITDFTIASTTGSDPHLGESWTVLSETPALGNSAILGPLSRGREIGPNQSFSESAATMSWVRATEFCNRVRCYWVWTKGGAWLGKTGYLGLTFQVDGQTFYGWAELEVGWGTGTLLGYAYETIPGRAIKAGETSYAWIAPASLQFGTVTRGSSASSSVALTNLGTSTLTITNATLSGTKSADFASENGNPPCAGSVAAGATCTLMFTFTPSIVGKETAIYSVYDDGGASPQILNLAGTGR